MAARTVTPTRRGLTDQDLERITHATQAARASGTHKIYQYAWEQWATWCTELVTAYRPKQMIQLLRMKQIALEVDHDRDAHS